jgi:quinolinate synthase
MKKLHPDAGVLVHPESPMEVIKLADAVGSTSKILQAAKNLDFNKFIVATDKGIFYQLEKNNPKKVFLRHQLREMVHNVRVVLNALGWV